MRKIITAILTMSIVCMSLITPVSALSLNKVNTFNSTLNQPQKSTDVLTGVETRIATARITDWNNNDSIVMNDDSGIPDPTFYACVLESGDIDRDGILTVEEARNIEYIFNTIDFDIKDIRGIQHLSSLKDTLINYDEVKDLSPIKNHPSLRDFRYIDGANSIEHSIDYIFDIISTISSIENLSIYDKEINSFDKIKGLNLISLDLNNTKINKQAFNEICTYYKNLTSLVLVGEKNLADIKGIKQLNSLTSLRIESGLYENEKQVYHISNLDELSQIKSLELLSLSSVKINDLASIVTGLQSLSSLTIAHLDMNDKVSLKNLPNLKYLSIINSNITEINVEDCGNLESIVVDKNNINSLNDINTKDNFNSITSLYISSNELSNLNGLDKFSNINFLSACDNKITNVTGIDRLINLTFLDLSGNKLTNIKGIEKLTNLYYLSLQKNNLNSVNGLNNLINLSQLYLNNNSIKSLPSLKNLKKLGYWDSVDGSNFYLDSIWMYENQLTKQELTDKMPDYFINHLDWNEWLKANAWDGSSSSSGNWTPPTNGGVTLPDLSKPIDIIDIADVVNSIKYSYGKTVTVKINAESASENMISKDILKAAIDNKTPILFDVVDNKGNTVYSWEFNPRYMNSVSDIKLGINFETEKRNEIQKITQQKNVFYVSFDHQGKFGGTAEVKVKVDSLFKNGDSVYLYSYNEAKGTIELKNSEITVQNGYATFNIDHCSVYFLTSSRIGNTAIIPAASANPQTGDSNTIFWVFAFTSALCSVLLIALKGRSNKCYR